MHDKKGWQCPPAPANQHTVCSLANFIRFFVLVDLTMPVFGSRFGVRISAVVLSLISAISISVTVFVERNISMCILLGVIPGQWLLWS